ncbi:hypothetical protein EG328_010808 [Venturia inaequalis]|uniref:Uncharacterized protein n=1 Tax=Venturia inaequalis TaxID=5025 RepID=A0A8H3Z7N8_VENIN|nr:hypothetical protein EG328_010808 [Venturia inaequalis]KAE9990428.1 hypothetical protein EG327_001381 [Venturia inaequalis]
MKPTAFLASLLTFAVMAAATPIDSIGRAASIQAAIEMNNALDVYNRMQTDESAMIGHTLCACQFAKHANLYLDATISACADLGGEMDIRDRKAGLGGIDFFGKYCRPHDSVKLDGKGFNIACRNHYAIASSCPWKS